MKFVILGVAAAAGVGAVALVQSELDRARDASGASASPAPAQEVARAKVLVATRSLMRGQSLREGAVEWREWPADLVPESFITEDEQPSAIAEFETALAKTDIVEGEPIKLEKVITLDHPGVLSAMLRDGMRAFAISIAQETGAGGFVLPSDYVDVILTRDIQMYVCDPEGKYAERRFLKAETLLSTVRVLAVDTAIDAGEESSSAMERTATLEVAPEQAVLLSLAERAGRLTLALRGIGELVDDRGVPRRELWPTTVVDLDLAREALMIAAAARGGVNTAPDASDDANDGHGSATRRLVEVAAEQLGQDCGETQKGPVVQVLRGTRLSDAPVQ